MSLQKILSTVRKAVSEFHMIEEGDKVAVGLSGGKDSLILLAALKAYQRFSPQKFELMAITVDMGFEGADFSRLIEFCQSIDVEYLIEHTQIADIIFNVRKETNPCSLCSKMRRGALASAVTQKGYTKLALGHHSDDLTETFLLSMFYEGRLSTFAPVSLMDRTNVTVIRPLLYTEEKDIAALSKDYPVFHNPCPANHATQREYMKDLIKKICKDIPFAKDRMFSAIIHSERYNLYDKYPRDELPRNKNK